MLTVSPGTIYNALHCTESDLDFYKLTVAAGQTVPVTIYDGASCARTPALDVQFSYRAGCTGTTVGTYTGTTTIGNCTASPVDYFIRVFGTSTNVRGAYQLSIGTAGSAPATDKCSSAASITITPGGTTSTLGTSVGACPNNSTDDPVGTCLSTIAYAQWYTVVGNGHFLTASTCNAYTSSPLYDTQMSVLTGTSCSSLTSVGCSGDVGSSCSYHNYLSIVSWCSVVGQTYYIAVGSYGSQGNFQLDLTEGATCDCNIMTFCGTPSETEPNNLCTQAATVACDATCMPSTARKRIPTSIW